MAKEIAIGLYEKSMPDHWNLREKLECVKRNGCDFIELSIDETDARLVRLVDEGSRWVQMNEDCRITGIPVGSICLSAHRRFPLGSRDARVRARASEILRGAVRLASMLGARTIQLAGYDVYYEESGADTEKYFAAGLREAVEFAARFGVTLAFETMETPFMDCVAKAMEYVRALDSPYLQVYPDIGNVTNAVTDVAGDLACGRGHIVAAHLKETVPGVYRDMEFGRGRVDFAACCQQLLHMGVRRFVCEFWYDGHSEPDEFVKRNADYIKLLLKRLT